MSDIRAYLERVMDDAIKERGLGIDIRGYLEVYKDDYGPKCNLVHWQTCTQVAYDKCDPKPSAVDMADAIAQYPSDTDTGDTEGLWWQTVTYETLQYVLDNIQNPVFSDADKKKALALHADNLKGLLEIFPDTDIAGKVHMFGQYKSIKTPAANEDPGYTETAQTDGLVVGTIQENQKDSDALKKCVGWLRGTTNGTTFAATGGNNVSWWNRTDTKPQWGDWIAASQRGSFMMPVKKGDTWSITYEVPTKGTNANQVDPYVLFYWIPLGYE